MLRLITYAILKPLFNVRTENLDELNRQRGPLLLLANHSSVIDPFIVAIFIRRPVQYVISDSQIRSRLQSFVLGLVGVIPKTKLVADLDTVKRIVAVKRNNGIIGLFPEGQSSWDGHGLPIVRATDKLVKSLKVPVFIAQIRGAYFSWPRWGRRFRRGEIRIFFSRLFTAEELRSRSADEVGNTVRDALAFNVFDYQRETGQRYHGSHQAEYLERALFICPDCESLGSLHSHRRRLSCRACGYEVHYTPYGFFEQRRGPLHFTTVHQWNTWQMNIFAARLERWLAAASSGQEEEALFVEPAVRLQQGYKTLPLTSVGIGRMVLLHDAIEFHPAAPSPVLRFPITEIEGMNVQNNEHLEFYAFNILYRVSCVDPRGNTYKWSAAVGYLKARLAKPAETAGLTLSAPL